MKTFDFTMTSFFKKDNKGKCLSVLALAFQCIILWIVEKNYKCAILKEES